MVGGLNSDQVNSDTGKLAPVASLVNIHHLGGWKGMVGPVSV